MSINISPPSPYSSSWRDLESLLWEGSMGVVAKLFQWGPESHKVSVVLLKCCSILFICKCCNLSLNVLNTNEDQNLRLFPWSARSIVPWWPKMTHLTAGSARVLCGGRLLTPPWSLVSCRFVCSVCQHRWWLVIYKSTWCQRFCPSSHIYYSFPWNDRFIVTVI